MGKYFVTSDIHGFYSKFKQTLKDKKFDINNPEHKIIICGDLFDRGNEAKELLDFLLKIPEDRLLIIRGNHEDLMEDCLFQIEQDVNISQHHWSNGTVDTIAQFSGVSKYDIIAQFYDYRHIKNSMKKYFKLISRAKDYIEIGDYIFVHGWIPLVRDYNNLKYASSEDWDRARWYNGMEDWKAGRFYENKTIVCGHWHTSYGHSKYHNNGSEFEEDACFEPFIDKGIIALDACTAYSKKINIYVIEH